MAAQRGGGWALHRQRLADVYVTARAESARHDDLVSRQAGVLSSAPTATPTAVRDGAAAVAVFEFDRATLAALQTSPPALVHTRFNALRGLPVALVEDSGFTDSPLVSWSEDDGRITSLSVARTPPLDTWVERRKVRDKACDDALTQISAIRAEVQGREHAGYFVSYRLDRD